MHSLRITASRGSYCESILGERMERDMSHEIRTPMTHAGRKMQYRKVGKTGMEAGIIGMGLEQLDRKPYQVAESTIHAALDHGINMTEEAHQGIFYLPAPCERASSSTSLRRSLALATRLWTEKETFSMSAMV